MIIGLLLCITYMGVSGPSILTESTDSMMIAMPHNHNFASFRAYLLIGAPGYHNFHWEQVVYQKAVNLHPVIGNVLQTGRQRLEAVALLQS